MLLNGDNFINWSRGVKMALGAKNKLGFIDGSLIAPNSTFSDFKQWTQTDYMILFWITLSMEPVIVNSFISTASARELWIDIVCDKLNLLEGQLDYSGGALAKCICNLFKKVIEPTKTKKLIQFGLNKNFDNVRTNMLTMEPLPTVLKAYHIIQ
ncbi:uncharacterized protein LOC141695272 [Apium graveolens]|uniref:uncharacterized protein LOC141695272 n=1 Tax=Apium graveolens TaxID=4045 RepID=UPI003D7B2033